MVSRKGKPKLENYNFGRNTSVTWLRKRCFHALFKTSGAIFFPGLPVGQLIELKKTDILDVVIMGDAPYSILNFSTWPKYPKYRIWTLSYAMSLALETTAKMSSQVLDLKLPIKKFKDEKKNNVVRFVYAGRFTSEKNILTLLKVAFDLNRHFKKTCSVLLIGDFDNTSLEKFKYKTFSLKNKAHSSEIKKFTSKISLEIRKPTQADLWTQQIDESDIFISFSTHWTEDFGVAVRQAVGKGCRAILSDWGGHKDVQGNVALVPLHKIEEGTANFKQIKAIALSRQICRIIDSDFEFRSHLKKGNSQSKLYGSGEMIEIKMNLKKMVNSNPDKFWKRWIHSFKN